MKYKFKEGLARGANGIVFVDKHNENRIVKLGFCKNSIDDDITFFNEVYPLGKGLNIFPEFYGVMEEVEAIDHWGKEVVAPAISIQKMHVELSETIASGLIPFEEIETKVGQFEEKLLRFYEETNIIIDDLHSGNLMFDENFENLYIIDCGAWRYEKNDCPLNYTYYMEDLVPDNYNSESFKEIQLGWRKI